MLKTIVWIFVLTSWVCAYGPVLKTGQTVSYDDNGVAVGGQSIRDDGYYKAGKARRYAQNDTDVVTDLVTGLQWQDNDVNVTKSWNEAILYCYDLRLDGDGWRLPTIEELETLVDYGVSEPSLRQPPFRHIMNGGYWSGSGFVRNDDYGWAIFFTNGKSVLWSKSKEYYVRCVRGEALATSNFSRDDNTGIVTDNTTGLQWQDGNSSYRTAGWWKALTYCEELEEGGYTDWRLPNIKELFTLTDHSRDPLIDPIFENYNEQKYWSSTSDAHYRSDAWYLDFRIGMTGTIEKDEYINDENGDYLYVRCVRGGDVMKDGAIIPAMIYLLQ